MQPEIGPLPEKGTPKYYRERKRRRKHRKSRFRWLNNKRKGAKRHRRRMLAGKDTFTCALCRQEFPSDTATIDHIQPLAKGGTNHSSNLQLACASCNHDKGCQEPSDGSDGSTYRGPRPLLPA